MSMFSIDIFIASFEVPNSWWFGDELSYYFVSVDAIGDAKLNFYLLRNINIAKKYEKSRWGSR